MNFDLKTLTHSTALTHKTDLMVIAVKSGVQKATTSKSSPIPVLSQYLSSIQAEESFEAKTGKTLLILKPLHVQAKRIMLLGVGDGSAAQIRKAVNTCFSSIKSLKYKEVTVYFDDSFTEFDKAIRNSIIAVTDSLYLYTKTKPSAKTEHSKTSKNPDSSSSAGLISVTLAGASAKLVSSKNVFDEVTALCEGVELAKEWGNRPPNYATPTHLGQVAQNLGKTSGIKVNVMGPKEVEKLGMGSFMSVSQGSSEPLRFISMEYRGVRAKTSEPIVLITSWV